MARDHADNTAALKIGPDRDSATASRPALLQVAAEELDMDMSQMRHGDVRHRRRDSRRRTPAAPAARASIATGGPPVRKAAAQAKQALLGLASTKLGVPVASLTVDKGVVSGGGKTVTYGELVGGKLFNVTRRERRPAAGRRAGEAGLGLQDGPEGPEPGRPRSTSRPR